MLPLSHKSGSCRTANAPALAAVSTSTIALLLTLALVWPNDVSAEPIRARNLPSTATHLPSPDVTWNASPNFNSRGSTTIDSIVIHTTESSLTSTINTFKNSSTQVSAHFVVASNGDIIQMVDTANRAWHATYYNSRSIGIEMVGYAHQQSTWNDDNVGALMDLLAWLVTAYDVPLVHPTGNAYNFPSDQYDEPGLVEHGQVQPWNRTDPGPYFPWRNVLGGTQARISAVPEPSAAAIAILAGTLLLSTRRWRRRAAKEST